MFNKRGLSKIVTTLIVILIAFIAIGVVWITIQNVLTKGVSKVDVSSFTLDLEILRVFVDPADNNLTIDVKRNLGAGNFQAIRFVIFNGTNTQIYDLSALNFLELEIRTFKFPEYHGEVKSLKIAPIFVSETGEEIIGGIESIVEIENDGAVFVVPEVEENETINETCEPTFVFGEDYFLPENVLPENFSGFIGYTTNRSETYSQRVAWLLWKDLEPEKGVYDWTSLENSLNNAADRNQTIQFWVLSTTCGNKNTQYETLPCSVPDWVFTEYGLDPETLPGLGGTFDIMVIPGWWPAIRTDFNNMIRALGEEYGDDPRITSVYIQGISASRGEEFSLEPAAIYNLEQNWGFSSLVLEEWIQSRMDAYADAFSSRTHICAWVGKTENWYYVNHDEYISVAENVLDYAWSKGIGNRGGIIEAYYSGMLTIENAFGLIFDDEGYVNINESHPPIANNLYFGEENEEYNDEKDLWVDRWCGGVVEDCMTYDPHRYRMSMMRSMMNRFNHLWLYDVDYEYYLNPELRDYTQLSLGKNSSSSPDAWSFLFEHPTGGFMTPAYKYKNFERWLYQRDIPGGMTVPDELFYVPFNAGGNYNHPERWFDYTVRRTDLVSGNDSIYFELDDSFSLSDTIEIKVEILDSSETVFGIEYYNSNGILALTSEVNTIGDDLIKTYTFRLNNFRFENEFNSGMDFRIVNFGSEDLSVKWVRVIRDSSFSGCFS